MIALAALAVFTFALAPARAAVKNPDTFTQLVVGDVVSLDPHWSEEIPAGRVLINVYEPLVSYKPGGATDAELIPMLAERVPTRANGLLSRDGRVYRFPIRKGVRFHDGSLMTPEDVRYSLLRFMLVDRAGGPSASLLRPLLGVASTRADGKPIADLYDRAARAVTVDGDAVVLTLPKPYAPLLAVLSGVAVVSKAYCVAHGQWDAAAGTWQLYNDPPVQGALQGEGGTGPFLLERDDRASQQVILSRFDGYWRGPARLKRAIIKTVPEFATRKLMLESGDADSIVVLPGQRSQLERLPGVTLLDGYHTLLFGPFLIFTQSIEPRANPYVGSGKPDGDGIPADFFAEKDVRLGFARSIDAERYARESQQGGRPAAGFIPPGVLGHAEGPPPYGFDPKAAAEHFKRARGGEVWRKGFRMTIPVHAGRDDFLALAQMLKTRVEALNPLFKIDLRQVASSSLNPQLIAHRVPLALMAWSLDYPDPDDLAGPLLSDGGHYPERHRYKVPGAGALVAQAAEATDAAARARLYARLQKLAADAVAFVPVYEGVRFRAQRSWVKGFVYRPTYADAPQAGYFYDLYKAE